MKRKYVIAPCPGCDLNRVWSTSRERWECIDCEWPVNKRQRRLKEIAQRRESYFGDVEAQA